MGEGVIPGREAPGTRFEFDRSSDPVIAPLSTEHVTKVAGDCSWQLPAFGCWLSAIGTIAEQERTGGPVGEDVAWTVLSLPPKVFPLPNMGLDGAVSPDP